MNGKKYDGDLNPWFLCKEKDQSSDIYVIGLQEMVDLNAINVAINSASNTGSSLQKAQAWKKSIMDCLNGNSENERFQLMAEKLLVGLYIVVFVRESLVPKVGDIRTTSTGVGSLGVLGNKGCVAIRMNVYDTPLCFICSHLAAHLENVQGRNADFKNIIDRTLFTASGADTHIGEIAKKAVNDTDPDIAKYTDIVMHRRGAARFATRDLKIYDHEIIIWLGDLNYRISDELGIEHVFEKIAAKQQEELLQYDQLNRERQRGVVFQGFEEELITFPPTYKFQPGTDLYEQRPEKKLRTPAWCDRILWKSESEIFNIFNRVTPSDYRCVSDLNPSDHKPVSIKLDCTLKNVIENDERKVFSELVDILCKTKSDTNPSLEVNSKNFFFEAVRYKIPTTQELSIKNVGASIMHWHFAMKEGENVRCKSWLKLSQQSGLLLPGEGTTVLLTVSIDEYTSQVLNTAKDCMEDVLIFRAENFPDLYIHIEGSYMRSSFGMPLEVLVKHLKPVSKIIRSSSTTEEENENPVEAIYGKL